MHPAVLQACRSLRLSEKLYNGLCKIAVPAMDNGSIWMSEKLEGTEWIEELRSRQNFGLATKQAFGTTRYVNPKELNHELPNDGAAEMAFIGRSNVGKSTLLGALAKQPQLFRRSKRPGCTTTVNFYSLKGQKYQNYLVDMPGYGYAARADEERANFSNAALTYLAHRDPAILRHVVLLIDARRGLSSARDDQAIDALHRLQISHHIVITKIDLVNPPELAAIIADIFLKQNKNKELATCLPILNLVSAKSGFGISELKDFLASFFVDHDRTLAIEAAASGVN